MNLSIVIPCYNEVNNLAGLFERLRITIEVADFPIEFILVNNGSQDHSKEVFSQLLTNSDKPSIKIFEIEKNKGYGYGIIEGLKYASGEFIGWTHADLQTDPLDALLGFKKMKKSANPEYSILCGRRLNRPISDEFFTFCMAIIASIALQMRLTDINAQPKIFHRSLLEKMTNPPIDFSLDLYLLWLAKNEKLQVIEQPVIFSNRQFGEAKGGGSFRGKMKLITRTWKYIFELSQKLQSR